MTKFKNVKRIINPKILCTLSLAGIGLTGQQRANAMFNPPKNQQNVKHFNGASTTIPSRSPLSGTSSITSSRLNQGAKNIPHYKPSGSRVSSLVAKFESTSTTSNSNSEIRPTTITISTQSSGSSIKSGSTSDYSALGAKPKISTDKKPSTYTSTLTINLGSKTSSSTSKDTNNSGLLNTLDLGTKFKTTPPSSKPSTKPLPPRNEITLVRASANFGDLVEGMVRNSFKKELDNELDIIITGGSPSSTTLNKTLGNLWKNINDDSKTIFKVETRKELSRQNILLTHKGEEDLDKASKDFGNSVANIIVAKFRRKALSFGNVKVTNANIPEINKKIENDAESLGYDASTMLTHKFIGDVNKFIEEHR